MKTISNTKQGSTVFLRLAASAIAIGVLVICVFLLPKIWIYAPDEYPGYAYAAQAIVIAMYIAAVPFYYGIYKGWQVLDAIDSDKVFSKKPVRALKVIAYLAAFISFIYTLSLPFFYVWADNDDAPGLMVIGLFLVGMPLIVSVAIGLLHRILAEATNIKSENDLTV